jgi:hypothetical protein
MLLPMLSSSDERTDVTLETADGAAGADIGEDGEDANVVTDVRSPLPPRLLLRPGITAGSAIDGDDAVGLAIDDEADFIRSTVLGFREATKWKWLSSTDSWLTGGASESLSLKLPLSSSSSSSPTCDGRGSMVGGVASTCIGEAGMARSGWSGGGDAGEAAGRCGCCCFFFFCGDDIVSATLVYNKEGNCVVRVSRQQRSE